ncbi:BamA/TamA family outer membrane protein [Pontibacter sp. G13]|uniref:BamA/TamA family outer membrane protein n=1 Tax=Pontibacter sp. G13 TaxID=3074898 RepID=UPI002889AC9E|nr:BamA/TamA family outer membrane protein [Pontibacter sp. G13]WNJ19933.1 BamA/TamA family outer membrane protein [Pontibacter sp. G13]
MQGNIRCFPSLLSLLLIVSMAIGQSKQSISFRDTLDGKSDMSQWLMEARGFVPIPSIITEPALGYGGMLGGLYLHRKKVAGVSDERGIESLPSMSFAAPLATSNGTWAVFGGHSHVFNEDRIRLLVMGGYFNINLEYYQLLNQDLPFPINFNQKGWLVFTRLMMRIKDSNFLIGPLYRFQTTDVGVRFNASDPILDDLEDLLQAKFQTAGLGVHWKWETRDYSFTTNKGNLVNLQYTYYDKWLGGDFTYHRLNTQYFGYFKPWRTPVMGFRVDGKFSFGDIPTFFKPYVDMRGVPAMRYTGDHVIVLENEERIDLTKRWALVAFGGVGMTSSTTDQFVLEYATFNAGGGFRYNLARLFNMYMGIDVGVSKEDWAWYITFGSAWSQG